MTFSDDLFLVEGNEDPHVGIPVIDVMDPEEWRDTRDDNPPNPVAIAHHVVDLHNNWLELKEDSDSE